MIAAILVGAGLGAALLLLGYAIVPARTDLAAEVGRWEAGRAQARLYAGQPPADWRGRLGRWLASKTNNLGIDLTRLRSDLELTDHTLEDHLVRKVGLAVFGLVLPTVFTGILYAGGATVPAVIPGLIGPLLGLVFFFVPDLAVRQEATQRREELRRALGCYLDLVSMSLAGGRGVPEALPTCAAIGQGWAFDLIADTITHARRVGDTPWEALGALGERANLPELRDLGGALSLVADDGAKVRESLTARAATLRRRQLADAEGEAANADQSISMAQVLLAAGFLLFIGYPAVVNVMAL